MVGLMRARTLALFLFFILLALPTRSLAAPLVISQHSGVEEPYEEVYGFNVQLNLDFPDYFVASGTLQSFVAPAASTVVDLTGDEALYVQLMNIQGSRLIDCKTPTKTADEWGITRLARDPHAPMVTFGPFSGTECFIEFDPRGFDDREPEIFKASGLSFDYAQMGLMGKGRRFNFVAYGPDVSEATSTDLVVEEPPPPEPQTSSVLFIPGTQASRLYVREADGSERELWEPSINSDIPLLALNTDGTSVHEVYTRDVVDTVYGNNAIIGPLARQIFGQNVQVYGDFMSFLDTLVASTTLGMKEWRSYPYDWRYGVRDVVEKGSLTSLPDGSLEVIKVAEVLREMAADSATGKVTIVGHSNGGLVAKALIDTLESEGEAELVDQLITVGTPHYGTPVDVGVLLHGDGGTRGLGIVTYGPTVRAASRTMPGPHDLLPSPAYFSNVADPVATFGSDESAGRYLERFPNGITSFSDLASFATDAFGLNKAANANDLTIPLALSDSLVENGRRTHEQLDEWAPPAGLEVTSIAGWGQLTVFGYRYAASPGKRLCITILNKRTCDRPPTLSRTVHWTEDGDSTVVAPSAAGIPGDVWYFDAEKYEDERQGKIVHKNLTSAFPVQNQILDLLNNLDILENYLVPTQPIATKNPLTKIGGKSPINILVTDATGNQTGILPVPGASDIYFSISDIPGSAVDISGEEKYIYLPPGDAYTVTVTGYDGGWANIELEELDEEGKSTLVTTLADLPITASTTASFTLNSGTMSALESDTEGDGTVDITLAPVPGELVAYEVPEPEPEPELTAPPTSSGVGAPTSDVGAANNSNGGGAYQLPLIDVITSLLQAPTTTPELANTIVPELVIEELATSTPTPTPEVIPAPSPVAVEVEGAPGEPEAVEPPPEPSGVSQTAAVINAGSGVLGALYDWVQGSWHRFVSALKRFL